MIKFTILYPNTPGARFDHVYYREKHMPLVAARMGSHLKSYAIDRGLSGRAPGEAPAYVAIGYLLCETIEDFQAGFGPHAQEILADVPNYTDVSPSVQISEIVVS
ncbi:MAG TPA: EthD family reductase [Polyangiales bacterium]|nr:EthD family reductase [Polyangiales bacterium]